MSRVLYISYDGALDPLGRSQVVPYLEGLAKLGWSFDLLTWEKPARWREGELRRAMEARLEASGVRWHPLAYRKRPPVLGTALDLWRGLRRAVRVVEASEVRLVHARSYPSALVALRLARKTGLPWMFDMRGLYAEERVDGGLWAEDGWLYRLTKRLEAAFFRSAAAVVTLTRAGEPVVRRLMERAGAAAPLEVIPTCVDLTRFAPAEDPDDGPPTLAYLGSVGTWYLLDEMLAFARVFTEEVPRGRVLFLTNAEPERVLGPASAAGLPADRIEVRSVLHEEVPGALGAAHATFFFIAPLPSKAASCPTKFTESLALGLPVAVNRGVGDCAAVVESEGVGVVVEELEEAGYRRAVGELGELAADPSVRARCRRVAEDRYGLARGVEAYDAMYRRILEPGACP